MKRPKCPGPPDQPFEPPFPIRMFDKGRGLPKQLALDGGRNLRRRSAFPP